MPDDVISDLLLRIATQDRVAFRDLYSAAAPKLTAVLARMLANRAEVDDALQEVFIRIWQRAAQYSPDRGLGMGWLIAVARNHALDRLRARPEAAGLHRVTARDDEGEDPLNRIPDPGAGVEAGLVAKGEARRVLDCFGELEPDRAAAVKGAYVQGLSYLELASRHDVPVNTMRTWLRRGLLRLRECMER